MTREAKKEGAVLPKTEASSKKMTKQVENKEIKQPNPSGVKETAKKTDRRNPKKGLPINSPGRESSKS
jgi:hypothetical protein